MGGLRCLGLSLTVRRQDLMTIASAELMTPPDPPKRPIGFVTPNEKKSEG